MAPLNVGLSTLTLDPLSLVQAVVEDADAFHAKRRRLVTIAAAATVGAVVLVFFGAMIEHWHFDLVWRYETAGLLGAAVGTAELLSRYRDAPANVLLSGPGAGYIVINACAALGAMGLVLTFGWRFGATGAGAAATQVLAAGFGSMALFRSSLLTVKAGSDDVGIGPSSVLSVMMDATDRSADRLRAAERAGRIRAIMANVSYEKARDSLPTVAVALMQNLSPADAAALNADLAEVRSADLPDTAKALLLGLKITDAMSTEVLVAAKKSLGATILRDGGTEERFEPGDEEAEAEPVQPPRVGANGHDGPAAGLPQTPQTPSHAAPGGPGG